MVERTAAPGSDTLEEPPEYAEEPEHPGGIRGLLATALATVRTRLDLAAVEVEIYLLRTVQMLLWALAALACALLALVFGLVAIIAALWDTHRMAGVLGGALAFVILAAIFGGIAARALRMRPHILEGTLQQLEHDQHKVSGSGP